MKILRVTTIALATTLLTFTVTAALAQQACDAILSSSLMNQSEIVDRASASSALEAEFCRMTYAVAQSTASARGSGGWGPVTAEASGSESKFNEWKTQNCGSSSSQEHSDRYRFEAQKALSARAIEAWETCMAQQDGLTCVASPNRDPDVIALKVRWRPVGNLDTLVRSSSIRGGINVSGGDVSRLYSNGSKILPGQDTILIEREGNSNINISLSVDYGGGSTHSCGVFNGFAEEVVASENLANEFEVRFGATHGYTGQKPVIVLTEIEAFDSSGSVGIAAIEAIDCRSDGCSGAASHLRDGSAEPSNYWATVGEPFAHLRVVLERRVALSEVRLMQFHAAACWMDCQAATPIATRANIKDVMVIPNGGRGRSYAAPATQGQGYWVSVKLN